jgi:hypothetical protein
MTFKEEMQYLAYELIYEDIDFSTVSMMVTHRKPNMLTYDEVSGEIYWRNSDMNILAIVCVMTETQLNAGDIQVGDLRMVYPVIAAEQTPEVQNDYMILPNGAIYNILTVAKDAAEAAYVLQLRKSHGL